MNQFRFLVVLTIFIAHLFLPKSAMSDAPNFRLCDKDGPRITAVDDMRVTRRHRSSLAELNEFLDSVEHTPEFQEAIFFFERLAKLSISQAVSYSDRPVKIMSIAYKFRLALSVFQIDYCTHPDLLRVYDNYLSQLRKIKAPLIFDPKTLEGFLFLYESGVRGIQQTDVEFIADHLIDTPINRILRDRILALSRDPKFGSQALTNLCKSLSLLGLNNNVISDFGQIGFKELGCVDVSGIAGELSVELATEPSNFLVIRTKGRDLSVKTNLDFLPAFDLSSALDQVVLPSLGPSSERAVTIPLIALLSPKNTDGSSRKFQGTFDGIVTVIHLFLVHPSEGTRDERVAPQAMNGGELTISSTSSDLQETTIAFNSDGQLGASFLPSDGTPEILVEIDGVAFNSFIFNSAFLDKIGGSYVPMTSPTDVEMEDLLFVDTQVGRSILDVHVRVPLEWLQFLKPEQMDELVEVCGSNISQCVSSKLEEQLARSSLKIIRSCGGKCDMSELGIGLTSLQPAGSDAPRRLSAPNGTSGTLKLFYE